jgi:hypothetical protein
MLKRRGQMARLAAEAGLVRGQLEWANDVLAAIDTVSEEQRSLIRGPVLAACLRFRDPRYLRRYISLVGAALTVMFCLASAATAAQSAIAIDDRAVAPHRALEIATLLAAVSLSVAVLVRRTLIGVPRRWRKLRADRKYFVMAVWLVIGLYIPGALVVIVAGQAASGPPGRLALAYVVAAGLGAGLASSRVFPKVVTPLRVAFSREKRQRPFDATVVILSWLTAEACECRSRWSYAATVRALREKVTSAAGWIETDRSMLDRTAVTEIRLRRQIIADQRRLAGVVRRHGEALVTAKTAADYQRICASLTGGLLAALHDDGAALLAAAQAPRRSDAAARIARAAIPPIVLVGFALALTWIPGVDPTQARSARVLLLIAAILSAVPNAPGVSDTVRSTIEKALPWQKR